MRTLGWLFIVFGVVILGRDMARWMEFGYFQATPFGQIWYLIDRASLNTSQAFVERHVAIWLWQGVIGPILRWPAWVTLPIVGSVFLLVTGALRARQRRRRGF
jgi:hypothetical protein